MSTKPQHALEAPLSLVELFALPGSGKTTVVAAAAEQLRVTTRKDLSAEWTETSVARRAHYIGRAFANWKVLTAAARFAVSARMAVPESIFRLMRLLAKRRWIASQRGVILLDQGYLQDIWSILTTVHTENLDSKSISPLIRALYSDVSSMVVVIDVAPLTAASRIQRRTGGHSRFDRLPEVELRSAVLPGSVLQSQIIEAAKHAGLDVRKIDGSGDQEAVSTELVSLIRDEAPLATVSAERRPRRISIIGPTGSGKSYLARQLAPQLDLPVHELDELRRISNAPGEPVNSFHNRVAEIIGGDEWIIDGHYRDVRHQIWSRAELVVWLNYPLIVVGKRLYRRFRGKQTPKQRGVEVRTGAQQPASWTSRLGRLIRTLRERSEYRSLLRNYPNLEVVELSSTRATEWWLRRR